MLKRSTHKPCVREIDYGTNHMLPGKDVSAAKEYGGSVFKSKSTTINNKKGFLPIFERTFFFCLFTVCLPKSVQTFSLSTAPPSGRMMKRTRLSFYIL